MKSVNFLTVTSALLKAKLFGIGTPLAVTWQLTSKCNLRCKYCGVWDKPFDELKINDVKILLRDLKSYGTQYISFTGGEPLLRADIGEIVQFAVSQGFHVSVSTNGYFIPEKIKELKGVSDLKMSFDGPADIHDSIRGKGSFQKLMEAVSYCQQYEIHPSMQCVLSKHNLQYVDYILSIAKEKSFKVMFQPATEDMLWTEGVNLEAPPVELYRSVIDYLIQLKKKGAVGIRNSLPGLRHMRFWPENKNIYCSAGILSCDLLPDGSLLSCFRFNTKESKKQQVSFIEEFKKIEKSPSCQQCWCGGLVEFNLIASFNFQAIMNWILKF